MKLIKKTMLTAGSIASVVAPVGAAISCGSSDEDMTKIITIQAEKGWASTYNTIIKDFKGSTEGQKLMKDNDIKDIRILEMGSFDTLTNIQNTSFNNEDGVADTFLIAADKMTQYLATNGLAPFAETDADAFLNAHSHGSSWVSGPAANSINTMKSIGLKSGKLYGVPENVEAMIQLGTKSSSMPVVTQFANLWMAAGFFNVTSGATQFNFRDIVSYDGNGKIVKNVKFDNDGTVNNTNGAQDLEDILKTGFSNILTAIGAAETAVGGGARLDQEAFNADAAIADAKVRNFLVAHKEKVATLDGPWNAGKIAEQLGITGEAKSFAAPATWSQFGGGWLYGMNARTTQAERNVIEPLIGSFYNAKYASALYTEAGKVSPVQAGRDALKADTDITTTVNSVSTSIPESIYGTNVAPRPLEASFDIIWGVYSATIAHYKAELASASKPTAQQLYDTFNTNLDAAIATANA